MDIGIAPLSTFFLLYFETVPTVWYAFSSFYYHNTSVAAVKSMGSLLQESNDSTWCWTIGQIGHHRYAYEH